MRGAPLTKEPSPVPGEVASIMVFSYSAEARAHRVWYGKWISPKNMEERSCPMTVLPTKPSSFPVTVLRRWIRFLRGSIDAPRPYQNWLRNPALKGMQDSRNRIVLRHFMLVVNAGHGTNVARSKATKRGFIGNSCLPSPVSGEVPPNHGVRCSSISSLDVRYCGCSCPSGSVAHVKKKK